MGDLGERWTAGELRTLKQQGWRVVNHVILRQRDIDHVLVGPGGVYAIETKWTAFPWSLDGTDERIKFAAQIATGHARDLRLWQPFHAAGVGKVTPVVFLWGGKLGELAPSRATTALDGAVVVAGPLAKHWTQSLTTEELRNDQIDHVWRALDEQCKRRDPHEDPPPPSLTSIFLRLLAAITSASAGFLAAATLIGHLPPHMWGVLASVGLLVLGAPLTRVPRVRPIAWSWIVGATCVLALVAVALVSSLM